MGTICICVPPPPRYFLHFSRNSRLYRTRALCYLSRKQILEKLDNELERGNERLAVTIIKESDAIRCFGRAKQVPQKVYTLEELKLNGIETASLLSPEDSTLRLIERGLIFTVSIGGLAAWNLLSLNPLNLLFFSLIILFLWTFDLIAFNGGVGFLVVDTIGHKLSSKYRNRIIQHEAGHFLVAYLVGILPKGYTLTSLEALKSEGSLNIQAGTSFVDFDFLEEVSTGKVSATTLNRLSCVALAGVATEYLYYKSAEGGLADINKLDDLLKGLGFTQKKAEAQVRWSLLNTVFMLRRHEATRVKLAEAMSSRKSVGSCIDVIEENIDYDKL